MELTRRFSQQQQKIHTQYHVFRFADTCKNPKQSSNAKYLFLFLCFILKLKIQGHAQLAVTFYVQSCEYASLTEASHTFIIFFFLT